MSNLEDLRNKILPLIKDENYDTKDLISLLTPIENYISDKNFMSNLRQVTKIITKDRDGNNNFNLNDLKLLAKDTFAVMSLVNAIMLVLNSVSGLSFEYRSATTEELIFKLLAYVFLVVVPKETGQNWSNQDKKDIVNLTLVIYQLIKSSQMAQNFAYNTKEWFKSTGICKCFTAPINKQEIIDLHLPQINADLQSGLHRAQENYQLKTELASLKEQLSKLSSDSGESEASS